MKTFMANIGKTKEAMMRRVTLEWFAANGYTESEIQEIDQLGVGKVWLCQKNGKDNSVRRIT